MQGKIPAGRSLIYFVRPESIMAGVQTYRVLVNDEPVANIPTGFYFAYSTTAGRVIVSAKTAPSAMVILAPFTTINKPTLEVGAEAGKIAFIKIGVSFFGGPTLEQVDTATGETLVAQSRDMNLRK